MMFKIKNNFKWLIIIFTSSVLTSCFSIFSYIQDSNFERRIVNENDKVVSVKVLYNEEDIFQPELGIVITFKDNQWIYLSQVTKKQNRIEIHAVNGYRICYYIRAINEVDETRYYKTLFYAPYIETMLRTELNMRFENLNHIIQNIDEIAAYMDSLEDITSEKFQNKPIEWFWSDEADLKKIRTRNFFLERAWSYEGIVFKSSIAKP